LHLQENNTGAACFGRLAIPDTGSGHHHGDSSWGDSINILDFGPILGHYNLPFFNLQRSSCSATKTMLTMLKLSISLVAHQLRGLTLRLLGFSWSLYETVVSL